VGDLYLAGGLIIGEYVCLKPGHALNNEILKALFADPTAWTYEDLYDEGADVVCAAAHKEPAYMSA